MTLSETHDPDGARRHARAQEGTQVESMPTLPAAAAEHWPDGLADERKLWAETVDGGGYTALAVARGTIVELVDLDGDACAHLALFNALQPDERLNVADTVKVQWQAYLTAGRLLLSDRGRVLATILADTSEHHDTFGGTTTRAQNTARYGDGSPQSASPAGRELLILGAAKFGLQPRDLPPTVALFKGTRVESDGSLRFTGGAGPGAAVRLRAELPLIVLIANVPHPLDPLDRYLATPLRVRAWADRPGDQTSAEVAAAPEARRAFANTIAYANLKGIT